MKEKIKDYSIAILIVIIICLIIIIGFVYGEKTTEKVKEQVIEKKEEIKKEVIENNYLVDIKGEIVKPGVYELEENKRIIDVINKAGGLTKNASTDYINLSKKIKDEMVIIIYSKKEIEEYKKGLKEEKIKEVIKYEIIEKECVCPNTINDACIEENNSSINGHEKNNNEKEELKEEIKTLENDKTNEIKLVNINTATIEELQTLKGLGISKAQAIIEYREKTKFINIEDIKNVSGIGDALFEKIKDYITI